MNTPTRLAGFVAVAAAVFGLALLVGQVLGPDEVAVADHDAHSADPSGHSNGHEHHDSSESAGATTEIPGGLMTSQHGYTLALADETTTDGRNIPVAFTITGPDGAPVTAYDVQHEKQLHLIAVRRDFSGFQHVHPDLNNGIWSTDLDLTAGTWRLFADFKPTGADPLTLGADLAVAGTYHPTPVAEDNRSATVGDYEVSLDGDLAAGAAAKLTLTVTKDGRPVTDLQPYLGAYGHLVALRSGDLAYLHVHPDGEPNDGTTRPGPEIVFHTEVPSAGRYHLYLDFKHEGEVRTAAFTLTVDGAGHHGTEEKGAGSGHSH